MQELNKHVLYVDDEPVNLAAFNAYFRRYYKVFLASSVEEAENILNDNEIHVLITDQRMPKTVGTKLLEDAVCKYPEQTRILLTAYADNDAIIDAFQRGLMYRYILKPYNSDELKEIIDTSYEIYVLKKTKEVLYKEYMNTQKQIELLKKK
ncbi:MAG: response regulator receiver protein [Bacteroidetes bacterium]|jgi:DNA-binding NtrC family response regulator|nr:response regulator receiver protein [Bacteroidota bacterium]